MFGGRAVRGRDEIDRDTDRAKTRMNSAAIFHSRFQSLRIERSRGCVFSAPKARHSFGSLGRRPMENSTSQNAALKARFIPEPLQFHYCHHPG